MTIPSLTDFTNARVSLGRSGNALRTADFLALQAAHALAREAVHATLDTQALRLDCEDVSKDIILVRSAVPDRPTYLRRPDLGRRLNEHSRSLLLARKAHFDAVFVIADGLSAVAVQRHAPPLLSACMQLLDPRAWHFAPLVIAEQGRVAIGDEIGQSLGAELAVVLIGERPGLSSSDSLGVYLTWHPEPGLTDASRNCISNIRHEGLSYELAAHKLNFLMSESRRRQLSGVDLKEAAKALAPG